MSQQNWCSERSFQYNGKIHLFFYPHSGTYISEIIELPLSTPPKKIPQYKSCYRSYNVRIESVSLADTQSIIKNITSQYRAAVRNLLPTKICPKIIFDRYAQ